MWREVRKGKEGEMRKEEKKEKKVNKRKKTSICIIYSGLLVCGV